MDGDESLKSQPISFILPILLRADSECTERRRRGGEIRPPEDGRTVTNASKCSRGETNIRPLSDSPAVTQMSFSLKRIRSGGEEQGLGLRRLIARGYQ